MLMLTSQSNTYLSIVPGQLKRLAHADVKRETMKYKKVNRETWESLRNASDFTDYMGTEGSLYRIQITTADDNGVVQYNYVLINPKWL